MYLQHLRSASVVSRCRILSPRIQLSRTECPRWLNTLTLPYYDADEDAANLHDKSWDTNDYTQLLNDCKKSKNSRQVRVAHAHFAKSGLEHHLFLANNLISLYFKCREPADASLVFQQLQIRDEFSWTGMVVGFVQNGMFHEALEMLVSLHRNGFRTNPFALSSVIGVCRSLTNSNLGMAIHGSAVKSGLEFDVFVGSAFVDMYVKCKKLDDACQMFERMPERNVVSWTALVSGYSCLGNLDKAFEYFVEMQWAGVKANAFTLSSLISACNCVENLSHGRQIHSLVVQTGIQDASVGNALITMYARCGNIQESWQVFWMIPYKDVVSWTAIISGYVLQGQCKKALQLYGEMQDAAVRPNELTLASALSACSGAGGISHGLKLHTQVVKSGLEAHLCVGNALTAMYAKCENIDSAKKLFNAMADRDMVTMTSMIAGYAQTGNPEEALGVFQIMQECLMKPNNYTLVAVLSACAILGAVRHGKQIHADVIKNGFVNHLSVGNSVVALYAKCGFIYDAHRMFDEMPKKDVISWNSIITGYAQHGKGRKVIDLLAIMEGMNIKPDHITFIGILSACSHAGLVDEGCKYFVSMKQDYGIMPKTDHYGCMVDLFGRAGRVDEVVKFVNSMPIQPDTSVWSAILAASRKHNNLDLGRHAAKQLLQLDPDCAATHVMLASMLFAADRWSDAEKVRKSMREKRLAKEPGRSWIEVNNQIHSFVVCDTSHPRSQEIYNALNSIVGQIKETGYLPDTSYVLHDVEEEEKVALICQHSEKLAIVFGHISAPPEAPIVVTKNLRVCGDCHNVSKFISKVTWREIIMRDAHRFHCFTNGFCSCGDYW